MRRLTMLVVLGALSGAGPACGPTAGGTDADGGGTLDGPVCSGSCPGGLRCVPELGCVECQPGTTYCASAERIMACDATGVGSQVGSCDVNGGQTCVLGACLEACEAAAQNRSNIGCEYWPVDLPQFCDRTLPLGTCERSDPYAVMVANLNAFTVSLTIEQNDAAPGASPVPTIVDERELSSGGLAVIPLPQREVDGSDNTAPESLSGLTTRAYRLTASGPVVAYQLNTLYETDSIDASLLIPTSALDTRYRTLSWPSVVLDVAALKSRNRGFVTIVGTTPGTHVTVTAGGHVVGGDNVAETLKGGVIEADLGPFDVLHLAGTTGGGLSPPPEEGDLSGTTVESTAPVVVYAGHNCANVGAPGAAGACCCDHLEEQVPPASALGRAFAVTRSAPRAGAGDVWRVLADKPATTVTTTLPAPWNSFVVEENEFVEFYATGNFILEASGPVLVAQYLVGQEAGAGIGDPSLTFMPPIDQARADYVFLVPTTYPQNFVVVGRASGTAVRIDGQEAPGEFGACAVSPIGSAGGTSYEALVCPLSPGVHTLDAAGPVTLIEYGYGSTGSIAYVGGADVKRINVD